MRFLWGQSTKTSTRHQAEWKKKDKHQSCEQQGLNRLMQIHLLSSRAFDNFSHRDRFRRVRGEYFCIVAFLSDKYKRRSDWTVLFEVVTRGPPRSPVPDKYSLTLEPVSKSSSRMG